MSSGPTWSKLWGRLSSVCFCLSARSFSSSMGLIVDLYPHHPEIPLKAGRFFLCEAPLMWEVGRWVCMCLFLTWQGCPLQLWHRIPLSLFPSASRYPEVLSLASDESMPASGHPCPMCLASQRSVQIGHWFEIPQP